MKCTVSSAKEVKGRDQISMCTRLIQLRQNLHLARPFTRARGTSSSEELIIEFRSVVAEDRGYIE
jgi:hypothetical protein